MVCTFCQKTGHNKTTCKIRKDGEKKKIQDLEFKILENDLKSVLDPVAPAPTRPADLTPIPWDFSARTQAGVVTLPKVTCWKPGTDSFQFRAQMDAFGYKQNLEDGLYYHT